MPDTPEQWAEKLVTTTDIGDDRLTILLQFDGRTHELANDDAFTTDGNVANARAIVAAVIREAVDSERSAGKIVAYRAWLASRERKSFHEWWRECVEDNRQGT
jgi:hypothetical protein